jgi:tetratricopeptide (TPR) repeat protein
VYRPTLTAIRLLTLCFALALPQTVLALEWISHFKSAEAAQAMLADRSHRIAREPKVARWYVERGNIYFLLHQFDNAIFDFSKAMELDPAMDLAWFGRGMAHARNGDIDAGIKDLTFYLERNPDSSLGYTKRGVRYLWKGDRDRAEQDLERAVKLDPTNAEAHDDLGVALAQRADYADAIRHFRRTIELEPGYQKAHHNLAMTYYIVGKNSQALPAVDQALRLKPEDRNAMLLKAQILEALGRQQAARRLRQDAEFMPEGNWSEQSPIQ